MPLRYPDPDDAPWALLARHLAAETTPAEQTTLHGWLRADPLHLQILTTVTRAWERAGEAAPAPPLFSAHDVEAAWQRFQPLMSHVPAPARSAPEEGGARPRLAVSARRWGARLARRGALYALPLAALAYAFVRSGAGAPAPGVAVYGGAERPRLLRLPDGSRVWLNARSRLEYMALPAAGPRHARLTGEGYFEVQPLGPARPFLLSTATARVRVVGTAFNVRAYAAEDSVEVAVTHGRVWLARLAGPDSVLLTARTRAALHAADAPGLTAAALRAAPAPSANFRAWQTDTLRFVDAPVPQVAQALRATFGTQLTLAGVGFAQCRFTGTFAHPRPVQVLAVLQVATGATLRATGPGRYTLSGPGCAAASPAAGSVISE